ncbi:alpha/beta fold hydrolase [Nocardioides sp. GCM10027113]|uniref:alpha/beta fold hydrolase n=1 Tax=unclassified Nocardioides TaxID=2615069 RepID=UPI003614CB36
MPAPPRADGLHTTSYGDSGPLVVFCHGLFGQGKNWTGIAKELAADHRVLLVDMPHHGRSAWSDSFDYLDAADQVAGLFSEDDPVALVGHSMGGKIAMLAALRHPARVERLCVVDVSPVRYEHTAEFVRFIDGMKALDLDSLEQRHEASSHLEEWVPDRTIRSFLLQNLRRHEDDWSWQINLEVLGRDLLEIGDWPDDRLPGDASYDGPVLWMAGQNSPYVRDEYAEPMDRWFPRNRRVTIKDAGHWVHSEQPEVFVEVLRRFLT